MMRFLWILWRTLTAVAVCAVATPAPALEYSMGGLNMQAYCSKHYGQNYNAKMTGAGAASWMCVLSRPGAHDQKPIDALAACHEQYPKVGGGISTRNMQAKIINNGWACVLTYPERSVDLNLWCGKRYGGGFGASFTGTLASWACQKGNDPGSRHPITKADVTAACKQQWYSVQDAKSVGTTWECLLNPQ